MRPSTRFVAAAAVAVLCLIGGSTAVAKSRTQLVFQVKPPTAAVFIDDRPMGTATADRAVDVTPGFHIVRLVLGKDEHEERIKFEAGKRTIYRYEFDETPAPATDDLDRPASDEVP